MDLRRLLTAWAAATVIGAACSPSGAQNIYPDPSFEQSGVAGVARSGQRAGHLRVDAPNHWDALGGRLDVQPFARYRVTLWVKANVRQGTFYAPYCYEWGAYEWQFVSSNPVTTVIADWTRMETTFVSPYRTMYVHPLAYIDAAQSEAWVDDVSVEKVAEPEATMAEIAANASRSVDDTLLLVRWYVSKGRMADAERLLAGTEGILHADAATVLALAAKTPADRKRFAAQVVAYGGPTYNMGVARFNEMTTGMTDREKIAIVLDGLHINPTYDRAAQGAALVLDGLLGEPTGPSTVGERRSRITLVLRTLEAAMSEIPSGSPAQETLRKTLNTTQERLAQLQRDAAELGKCTLVIGGKKVGPASHAIVLPDRPTPVERYAARELQYHLELVTGQALPIVAEAKRAKAIGLFVGKCKSVADPTEKLPPEGLRVRTVGPAMAFTGNGRGVLYAVYSFLEDQIGCRWFTPDCSTGPKSGRIAIAALDRRYVPPLEYRGGDYPVARPGEFAARVRLNGAFHNIAPEQGGKVGVHSLAHTFAALCPPEKYFAQHPEYFSLVNGKRQSGYAQLCLTNPDVLKIVVEGVRQWIKENPSMTVFSVSQNDTANYCECPECTRVAEEEGGQAGPMIRFVNAVADAIAKEHPNIAIETLAYQYTRKPPKITKPRPNVIVCLCSIECCFVHPLESDSFNASFVEDIKGWSRICKRLWIWDYVINYAHSICPFPNLYVLKPNIQFFLRNGVRGIYEESCYYTKGSELQELRNYIVAKTLWDPNYDTDKAINEFCAAYYGPAAPHIRRYLDLIHRVGRDDPSVHVRIYTHPKDYITPEMIAEARAIFDQAEAAVQSDPVRLHRVQVARLPILYAEIVLAQTGQWVEQDGKLVQQGATDIGALADQFERIARAEGVTMIREGGPDATLDAWLKTIPRRPGTIDVLSLQNDKLKADLLPALGGRIWRLRRLVDQRDIIAVAGSANGWDPTTHGYEEYSEGGYRSPGWQEPYTVKERSERHAVLEADLSNGLRLTRRIELGSDAEEVAIATSVTNASGQVRIAGPRSHPAFAVTFAPGSRVQVRRPDGTFRTIEFAANPDEEQSVWLEGDEVPAGEWSIEDNGSGLRLVCTFDRTPIAKCLLNWSGPQKRVNLELFAAEKELAPGQSITLKQVWRIEPLG